MFDIISFGDYQMLVQALNGLAAITGSDGFVNMMRAAFVVGIITFGARAVMTNRFDAVSLVSGFIAYSVLFVPKVTVTVSDVNSGAGVPVANVPVGLAAPLTITSHVGRFFASTFESAFAGITTGSRYLGSGYLDALTVLTRMRDPTAGVANSDATVSGDIEKSVRNYIVGCVFYDLENTDTNFVHEVTREGISKATNVLDAIRTTYKNISVVIHLPSDPPAGTTTDCATAWTNIKALLVDGNWIATYFDASMRNQLGVSSDPAITSAAQRIDGALQALNLTTNDAQGFMLNSFLGTMLKRGEADYAVTRGDTASAVIRAQATNQRNVQWAAEKTMFEKTARPITAFIEVFMVAAGPIMAFAIAAFGVAGISTLGKFMMMHVWVCLWAPTLAIANMYIYTVVNRWIEYASTASGIDLLSQGGIDSLNEQLQTWLATGSMLAAATPMLTLMLLYGSSQVASVLATQMRGGEHIDPKVAAPSIQAPAPMFQSQALASGNSTQGWSMGGAAIPQVSLASNTIEQIMSSQKRMETAGTALNEALTREFRQGESGVTSVAWSQSKGFTVSGSETKGLEAAMNSTYKSVLAKTGDTARAASAAVEVGHLYQAGGGAEGGVSLGGGYSGASIPLGGKGKGGQGNFGTVNLPGIQVQGGVKGGLVAQFATKYGGSESQAMRDVVSAMTDTGNSSSFNEGIAARLTRGAELSNKTTRGSSHDSSTSDTSGRGFSKQWSEAQSASKDYMEAVQGTKLTGRSMTYTPRTLGTSLSNTWGDRAQPAMEQAWARSFGGDAEKQRAALSSVMNSDGFRQDTPGMSMAQKTFAAQAWVMMTNAESGGKGELAKALFPVGGSAGIDRDDASPLANSAVAPDVRPMGSTEARAETRVAAASIRLPDNTLEKIGNDALDAAKKPDFATPPSPQSQFGSAAAAVVAANRDNDGRVDRVRDRNADQLTATRKALDEYFAKDPTRTAPEQRVAAIAAADIAKGNGPAAAAKAAERTKKKLSGFADKLLDPRFSREVDPEED